MRPIPELLFDHLYENYEPMVERWVRRLAGPSAEVEDLIHDVFVVALRRRGEFRGEAKVSTWLFRITELVVRKRRFRRKLGSAWMCSIARTKSRSCCPVPRRSKWSSRGSGCPGSTPLWIAYPTSTAPPSSCATSKTPGPRKLVSFWD
jgi:hypothetical protein